MNGSLVEAGEEHSIMFCCFFFLPTFTLIGPKYSHDVYIKGGIKA